MSNGVVSVKEVNNKYEVVGGNVSYQVIKDSEVIFKTNIFNTVVSYCENNNYSWKEE